MWTFIGLVVFAGIGIFAYRLTKFIDECNNALDEQKRIVDEQLERLKTDKWGFDDE